MFPTVVSVEAEKRFDREVKSVLILPGIYDSRHSFYHERTLFQSVPNRTFGGRILATLLGLAAFTVVVAFGVVFSVMCAQVGDALKGEVGHIFGLLIGGTFMGMLGFSGIPIVIGKEQRPKGRQKGTSSSDSVAEAAI